MFLCEQFSGTPFSGEGTGVFAHQSDIAKMNQACIEGNMHHHLKVSLVGKIATDAGVEVLHEPGGVHIVPDQPVPSAVALGRSIHKEMNFVQWQHSQEIPGR